MSQAASTIKVLHVITRLIIGGAQENTLYTVTDLKNQNPAYEAALATGPALGPEGSLMEEAKNAGFPLIVIAQLRREINPVYDFIAFFKLYRLIKKNNYTIVHTHSSKAGILGRWAAYLGGVPIIVHTIHGLPFHRYQHNLVNKLYLFLERLTAKITMKLITVSNTIIDDCVKAGLAERGKFRAIYSGIDPERFRLSANSHLLRAGLNIPEQAVVIGKLARLFHLKGHDYVLEAAAMIIQKNPEVYFLFIGDGILKNQLAKKARQLNIEKNIVFAGLIRPKDVPAYIQITDIIVHASLREGLPRAIVEAFACKKPVVSFDVDGAKELIQNNHTGYLVPPKDVNGLKEKLSILINDRASARIMGERGYDLVLQNFSRQKMLTDIDRLYQELLVEKQRVAKEARKFVSL